MDEGRGDYCPARIPDTDAESPRGLLLLYERQKATAEAAVTVFLCIVVVVVVDDEAVAVYRVAVCRVPPCSGITITHTGCLRNETVRVYDTIRNISVDSDSERINMFNAIAFRAILQS